MSSSGPRGRTTRRSLAGLYAGTSLLHGSEEGAAAVWDMSGAEPECSGTSSQLLENSQIEPEDNSERQNQAGPPEPVCSVGSVQLEEKIKCTAAPLPTCPDTGNIMWNNDIQAAVPPEGSGPRARPGDEVHSIAWY